VQERRSERISLISEDACRPDGPQRREHVSVQPGVVGILIRGRSAAGGSTRREWK
jgi:hypothetical protein